MSKATKELSLCGVLTALAVVLLCLGGMLPFAMYVCPMLASAVMVAVKHECRRSYAWSCYAAISILGVLLCPDKECAMLFCVLGYYPLIYSGMQRIRPRILRIAVKFMLFSAATALMYAVLLFVLAVPETVEEFAEGGRILMIITAALGVGTFFAYDLALGKIIIMYEYRRKKSGSGKMFYR